MRLPNTLKRCTKCGEMFLLAAFCSDRTKRDGLSCWCFGCRKAYLEANRISRLASSAEWKRAHPERVKGWARERYKRNHKWYAATGRRWNQTHLADRSAMTRRRRGRSRQAISTLTAAEWVVIKESYGNCCAYCGVRCGGTRPSRTSPTQDHVRTLGPDGPHTADNVVLACRSCNASKGTKPIEEWYGDLIRRQFEAAS